MSFAPCGGRPPGQGHPSREDDPSHDVATTTRHEQTSADVYAAMERLGVVLLSDEPETVAEEASFAYKDIDPVMTASASLVRPTKRLTPLGVVKG